MNRIHFIIACMCSLISARTFEEIQCSKYHYEEQILSKQIRMEIRLENLEEKVDSMKQQDVKPTCDDEWITFKSSCYLFGRVQVEFLEAEKFCQVSDAHLVSIRNQEENDFIKRHVSELSAPKFWIGMYDGEQEGKWKWIDTNQDVKYFNWNPGEPNQGRAANCVAIFDNYDNNWVDEPCTNRQFRPICKK
ncbi:hypothetical protein ACF0H5_005295 [Mactra antiquata]